MFVLGAMPVLESSPRYSASWRVVAASASSASRIDVGMRPCVLMNGLSTEESQRAVSESSDREAALCHFEALQLNSTDDVAMNRTSIESQI